MKVLDSADCKSNLCVQEERLDSAVEFVEDNLSSGQLSLECFVHFGSSEALTRLADLNVVLSGLLDLQKLLEMDLGRGGLLGFVQEKTFASCSPSLCVQEEPQTLDVLLGSTPTGLQYYLKENDGRCFQEEDVLCEGSVEAAPTGV